MTAPKPPDPSKILDKEGPQFPDKYNMSDFSIQAYVKGNWPRVVDYELEQPSVVLLIISLDGVEPFYYRLNSRSTARHQETLTIPSRFGDAPRPAWFALRSLSDVVGGETKPAYLRLYGIGAGPRAVGSMKIDLLRFRPASIRPAQRETATYSFHSHDDFTKAEAEFWLVGRAVAGGPIVPERVDVRGVKRSVIHRDESVSDAWDAKTRKGIVQNGQYQLQVCAWVAGKEGGDWATALSPELVVVR